MLHVARWRQLHASLLVPSRFQLRRGRDPKVAAPSAAYSRRMLSRLRDSRGEPSLRTRALALLVILGMVVLTAPVVVLPVVRALVRAVN